MTSNIYLDQVYKFSKRWYTLSFVISLSHKLCLFLLIPSFICFFLPFLLMLLY
jgi:hypothetical protein